jgi:uncharacterized membrane protein
MFFPKSLHLKRLGSRLLQSTNRKYMLNLKRSGLIIAFSALLLSLPAAAFAIGQITEPIVINDALRGQSYESIVTVVNTEKADATLSLSADGDTKDWVKFYETPTSENVLGDISLKVGEKKDLIARFTVPQSAANNAYTGTISVSGKPGQYTSNGTDSGSTVTQKIDREVTINVSDNEVVKFDASIIPESYDLAQGDLLKVRVRYDSQSNVDIKPQISFKIQNNGNTVYSAIFPYPDNVDAVKPGAIFEIPQLEIPTNSLQNGKYEVLLKISKDDKFSIDKKFAFSIGGTVKGASTASTQGNSMFGNMDSITRAVAAMILTLVVLIVALRNRIFKSKMTD